MKNQAHQSKPIWQHPDFIIAPILLAFLLLGLLIVTHYGQTWDESFRYSYAKESLAAYTTGATNLPDEKGPFYGMVAVIGSKLFSTIISGWLPIDSWHFMTYISFLIGIFFFFRLCRRLMDPVPATAATLLFFTQPIIWGHAFTNPKDTPFLSFFLASVTLGLEMVDQYYPQVKIPEAILPLINHASATWEKAPRSLYLWLKGLGWAWIGLLILYPLTQVVISWVIHQIFTDSPGSWMGKLFSSLAQNAGQIPVQNYIHKAQTLNTWLFLVLMIGTSLVFVVVARQIFFGAAIWGRNLKFSQWGLIIAFSGRVFPSSLGQLLKTTIQPHLLLASCFLGFASDIRTLGPASGVLVATYFLIRSRFKALPILLIYGGIGAVITYLCWPYLWDAPLEHYFSSFTMASSFDWYGLVLYKGIVYPNHLLPIGYLPNLFSLQFTEPAMGLILAGGIVAVFLFWKRTSLRLDLLLLVIWFSAPITAAIFLHSNLYNNFRQFLFIFPPLFVIAGLAFQLLWSWLKMLNRRLAFVGIVLVILLPGIAWNINLHPYEYIYYNGLIGNINGAYRNFDLDYWAASYKEEIEYLNIIAPPHSNVLVYGADDSAKTYARSDLKILPYPLPESFTEPIHYVLVITSSNQDKPVYPNSTVIHQVTRDNAVLSVIKQVLPSDAPTE